MGKIIYNKLVRDRIPEIIASHGKTCEISIADEQEYRSLLLKKLQEETAELAAGDNLTEELADIYEVLDAIVTAYSLSPEETSRLQTEKRSKRGAFAERIKLLWVDDTD
ncbi:MAG: nucleoside triphosphate pyrophosphohydrolase [Anaerolineae bacterium]|nr:nucleoside triphosphate pyrophosphohydrolase [Anaerolineae bacterium]